MATEPGYPPAPEEIADRFAIQDVLNLHSRGLDRLDAQAIKRCYWPEAAVDYGSYKGGAHDFAVLVVGALGGTYELTRHGLSNTLIEFTGSSARAESAVTAAHLLAGAGEEMLFYGRYLDHLENRQGQWKILHRQVVIDWSKRIPVKDERHSEAFAELARGAHFPGDPLYAFLNAQSTGVMTP